MLSKVKDLKGYRLHSRDGELGRVKEFYFDDQYWTVRYLVADTGHWLTDRQVLISPYALLDINSDEQMINVDLTKKEIEESPSLDFDKPVSRQFEASYSGYYGYPGYWTGTYLWGYSPDIVRDRENWRKHTQNEQTWDPNLRSTHNVSGYHIEATDGVIGHIDDFIIDDVNWTIRYLIVETKNWWPGKKVLVSPKWIQRVSWRDSKVFTNLNRESIKRAPEFWENSQITRDYEKDLHRHYEREGYWVSEGIANVGLARMVGRPEEILDPRDKEQTHG